MSIFYDSRSANKDLGMHCHEFQALLTRALEGRCVPGDNREKLHVGGKALAVYSVRTSKAGRFIFVDGTLPNGEPCIDVLDYLPNHEYGKCKYLNNPAVLKALLQALGEREDVNLNEGFTFEAASEEALPEGSASDNPPKATSRLIKPFHRSTQREFVHLTPDQDDILNTPLAPGDGVLIEGSPGAGKTLLAFLEAIKLIEENEDGQVVYVAQSLHLAEEMKKGWAAHLEEIGHPEYKDRFVVLSEENLFPEVQNLVSGDEKQESHSRSIFNSWLKQDQKKKYSITPDILFQEFRVVSGYVSTEKLRAEYLKGLGENQSFVAKDKAQEVLTQYDKFMGFLQDKQITVADFSLPKMLSGRIPLLILDEASDWPHAVLRALVDRVDRESRVMILADPKQSLSDDKAKIIYLQKLLEGKMRKVKKYTLASTHRCAKEVLALANKFDELRLRLLPYVKQEMKAHSSKQAVVGQLEWLVMPNQEIKQNIVRDRFKEFSKNAGVCFISPENRKVELTEALKKVTGRDTGFSVRTPKEAKGLSFDTVVVYRPFDGERALFKEANRAFKSESAPRDIKYSAAFSAIYAAITRARENVVFVLSESDDHDLGELIKFVKDSISFGKVDLKISSKADWEAKAKEFYRAGGDNKQYAKDILRIMVGLSPSEITDWEALYFPTPKNESMFSSSASSSSSSVQADFTTRSSVLNESIQKLVSGDAEGNKAGGMSATPVTSASSSSAVLANPADPNPLSKNQIRKAMAQEAKEKAQEAKEKAQETEKLKKLLSCSNPGQWDIEKIKDAIEKGGDIAIAIKNDSEKRFRTAIEKCRLDILELLLAKMDNRAVNFHPDVHDPQLLLYAGIEKGLIHTVQFALAKGADINKIYFNGMTPLLTAALNGCEKVVKSLIDAGANVNQPNQNGSSTPLFLAAGKGHKEIVRQLLANRADINKPNEYGVTPLSVAVYEGQVEAVQLLIDAGADVNKVDHEGLHPLSIALVKGRWDILELLLANMDSRDVNSYSAVDDPQLLLYAGIEKGLIHTVQFALAKGADIHKTNDEGWSSFHGAVQVGHDEIVQLLLDNNASINKPIPNGATPLTIAASKGHVDIVQLLLEKGAEINGNGIPPLFMAAQNGCTEVVALLLAVKGVEVNKPTTNKAVSPLSIAAEGGHVDVVKRLIEAGADVNQADQEGLTPLSIAAAKGRWNILELLLAKMDNRAVNFHPDVHDTQLMLYAGVAKGLIHIVLFALAKGADINKIHKDWTPLLFAAHEGHVAIVTLLLAKKAEVNKPNNNGETPLFMAAQNGSEEVVKLLIDAGANINEANKNGMAPLFIAVQKGHTKVVESLLAAKGVDVNQADTDGKTPLLTAARKSNVAALQRLIKAGADLYKADKDEWTPLLIGVYAGHVAVVQLLIEAGVDIKKANKDGWTPLLVASQEGHAAVVQFLIEAGVDINEANKDGWTPLSMAVTKDHVAVWKLLLEQGADIHKADKEGDWTPLLIGASAGHVAVVQSLIKAGAKINKASKDGWTPLLVAAQNGSEEVVRLLIKAGADINQANKDGLTSLSIAEAAGHQEIINILKAKLAASAHSPNESLLSAPPAVLFTGRDEISSKADNASKIGAAASARLYP